MPTPNGCYCNFSEWDLLVAILEKDQATFDRLQQVIQAVQSSGSASTLQSGRQAIATGADVACVIFPVPFAGVPNVVATLSRNAVDPVMELNIDEDSITATGFCVTLGGTTINDGYVIQWMAN